MLEFDEKSLLMDLDVIYSDGYLPKSLLMDLKSVGYYKKKVSFKVIFYIILMQLFQCSSVVTFISRNKDP